MTTVRTSTAQLAAFSLRIKNRQSWAGDLRQRRAAGFSLVEVLATIGVVSTLATLAVPSYRALVSNNQMTSISSEIRSAALLARSTAISLNRRITFCAGGLDRGCHGDWNRHEWLVFQDINRNGVVDSAEPVYLAAGSNVSTDVRVFSNGPLTKRVIFTSAGTAETSTGAFAAGRVRLCVDQMDTGNAMDLVLIGSGRFEAEAKTFATGCAAL